MSKAKRTGMALAAAWLAAVAGAWAGDSAPFWLDTREGLRFARPVEPITYSTEWDGGESVRVSVDGRALAEADAPATGEVPWNTASSGKGVHVLTHMCGEEEMEAEFAVIGLGDVLHAGAVRGDETWEGWGTVHVVEGTVAVADGRR